MRIKLFFDENFSKPATDALAGLLAFRESETIVDHYQNRWQQGKRKDQEWIPDLASEGDWIVIAGDLGRSGGPKLPRICAEFGVTHLLLSPAVHGMKTFEKMLVILSVWSDIEKLAAANSGKRYKLYAPATRRPFLDERPI